MPVQSLLRDIVSTHHAFLRAELPRLDRALHDLGSSPRLLVPWRAMRGRLERHLDEEEQRLFPVLSAAAADPSRSGPALPTVISLLQYDHEQLHTLESQLRDNAGLAGVERTALITLLDDLQVHAAKEEHQLYPAALALFHSASPSLA